MAAAAPFENWYFSIPPITRTLATAALATSVVVQVNLVSPYQLYFNFAKIVSEFQYWRIVTTFIFFGTFKLDLLFHMFFLVRYSRLLEDGYFRGRPADYLFMLLFGATLALLIAPFVQMYFLGFSLTFMMLYVWGRKNPHLQLNLLGMLPFKAPYLPLILLFFAWILNDSYQVELLGIATGHVYYFLEDIYPRTHGHRLLKTPEILKWIFERPVYIENPAVRPVVNPGGYDWGAEGVDGRQQPAAAAAAQAARPQEPAEPAQARNDNENREDHH